MSTTEPLQRADSEKSIQSDDECEQIEESLKETKCEDHRTIHVSNSERRNMKLENKLLNNDTINNQETIDLSSMNVIDQDMPLIIKHLFRSEQNPCVRLILSDNGLSANGVKILTDELIAHFTKLKSLVLSNNPAIGDAGIEYCARFIQTSRSLTRISLYYTGITDQGVRILANVLCPTGTGRCLPSLEALYMPFNRFITDHSLDSLIQILEQNQRIKTLAIQCCGLSKRARRKLKQVAAKQARKIKLSE